MSRSKKRKVSADPEVEELKLLVMQLNANLREKESEIANLHHQHLLSLCQTRLRPTHIHDLSNGLILRVLELLDPLYVAEVVSTVCQRWFTVACDPDIWAGVTLNYGNSKGSPTAASLFVRVLKLAPLLDSLECGLTESDPPSVLRALETCTTAMGHICIDLDRSAPDAVLQVMWNSRHTVQLFCLREGVLSSSEFSDSQANRFWELIEQMSRLNSLVLFLKERSGLASCVYSFRPRASPTLRTLFVDVGVVDKWVMYPQLEVTIESLVKANRTTLETVHLPYRVAVPSAITALSRCSKLKKVTATLTAEVPRLMSCGDLVELKLTLDGQRPPLYLNSLIQKVGSLRQVQVLEFVQLPPYRASDATLLVSALMEMTELRRLTVTCLPAPHILDALSASPSSVPLLELLAFDLCCGDLEEYGECLFPSINRLLKSRPSLHIRLGSIQTRRTDPPCIENHSRILDAKPPVLLGSHSDGGTCDLCSGQIGPTQAGSAPLIVLNEDQTPVEVAPTVTSGDSLAPQTLPAAASNETQVMAKPVSNLKKRSGGKKGCKTPVMKKPKIRFAEPLVAYHTQVIESSAPYNLGLSECIKYSEEDTGPPVKVFVTSSRKKSSKSSKAPMPPKAPPAKVKDVTITRSIRPPSSRRRSKSAKSRAALDEEASEKSCSTDVNSTDIAVVSTSNTIAFDNTQALTTPKESRSQEHPAGATSVMTVSVPLSESIKEVLVKASNSKEGSQMNKNTSGAISSQVASDFEDASTCSSRASTYLGVPMVTITPSRSETPCKSPAFFDGTVSPTTGEVKLLRSPLFEGPNDAFEALMEKHANDPLKPSNEPHPQGMSDLDSELEDIESAVEHHSDIEAITDAEADEEIHIISESHRMVAAPPREVTPPSRRNQSRACRPVSFQDRDPLLFSDEASHGEESVMRPKFSVRPSNRCVLRPAVVPTQTHIEIPFAALEQLSAQTVAIAPYAIGGVPTGTLLGSNRTPSTWSVNEVVKKETGEDALNNNECVAEHA